LAKPLMDELQPVQLTAAHAAVGAFGFVILSPLLEPLSLSTFGELLAPAPFAGLLFLVIFGTFVAYTIYLRLVRDWGAPRAGLYAFTSPVIALILGAIVFDEALGWRQGIGALLMLGAAAFAIRSRRKGAAESIQSHGDGQSSASARPNR
jgi:drug/metabolite transporter (DMT)-like permease